MERIIIKLLVDKYEAPKHKTKGDAAAIQEPE
jgi:hypothetical protein